MFYIWLNTISSFFDSHLFKTFILVLSGFVLRQTLLILGQSWVRGYHHFATYLLLPTIAYVITSVIANNLALSLGMIGALSIVRFRNPVKSPLELVMFFGLLTIGVAGSVNINWTIFLVFFIFSIFIFIYLYNNFLNLFNKSAYDTTFNEAKEYNLIEITCKNKIESLSDNRNLKYVSFDNNAKEWSYKLVLENKNELTNLINKLENIKDCSFNVQLI